MGFLDGLLQTKAKKDGDWKAPPGNADSIGRATGAAIANTGQGLGNVGSWDAEKAVKSGYERVIWIFRCIDVIAQNQASITLDLRKGTDRKNGELIENERLHRLLNFRPNTYESSWQFRYRLSSQVLLSRRGAFIEIVPGRDKMPAELHLLPVGKTKPIPDEKEFIQGFEVTSADNTITTLKPEQVIWVRAKPHPVDPYAQMTPLVAAGIEADTDFLARSFNRNFLSNDGRPGMLVTVDPTNTEMSARDVELLRQRFGGGVGSAGMTTVIEGGGISAQDMSASPRDTQWSELIAMSKERILLAFGVPESVMGNASGRTFDNADAEREMFWMDTMLPHCDNLAFSLDALTGDISDDQVFGFRYDEIDVLQRQEKERRQEWREEVSAGLRTIDEYFEASGQEKWDVLGTRILMNPNGFFFGRNEEDQNAIKEMVPAVQSKAPAGSNPQEGHAEALYEATSKWGNSIAARAMSIGKKSYDRQTSMESKQLPRNRESKTNGTDTGRKQKSIDLGYIESGSVERKDMHDHESEQFYAGILESWDLRMQEILPSRLDHAKVRKGTRHWDGHTGDVKALDAGYVVDTQMWLDDVLRAVDGRLNRTYRAALHRARQEAREMGMDPPTLTDAQIDAEVQAIRDIAETAARNQLSRVEDRIDDMEQDGATLEAMKKQVRQMLGARSSWRKLLAANIATTAEEKAKYDLNSNVDGMVPVWMTADDERVRESHQSMDGQQARNGMFTTGAGVPIRFPGDPTAPPSEVVNCRCWTVWQPGEALA